MEVRLPHFTTASFVSIYIVLHTTMYMVEPDSSIRNVCKYRTPSCFSHILKEGFSFSFYSSKLPDNKNNLTDRTFIIYVHYTANFLVVNYIT